MIYPFFGLFLSESSFEKRGGCLFDRAAFIKDSSLLEEGELFSWGQGWEVVQDGL